MNLKLSRKIIQTVKNKGFIYKNMGKEGTRYLKLKQELVSESDVKLATIITKTHRKSHLQFYKAHWVLYLL